MVSETHSTPTLLGPGFIRLRNVQERCLFAFEIATRETNPLGHKAGETKARDAGSKRGEPCRAVFPVALFGEASRRHFEPHPIKLFECGALFVREAGFFRFGARVGFETCAGNGVDVEPREEGFELGGVGAHMNASAS